VRSLTVLVEQCLAPVPGGTGRYTAELTRALVRHPPAGWEVSTVTAWHRDTSAARVPGVEARRLPVGARALAVLWQHGLPPWPGGDSVHATTPLAPARRSRPLVVTVHDAVPWTDPDTLTPHGAAWHRAMIGRLARTADAIVVPTAAVAQELSDRLPVAGKVHVIGHGVTAFPVPADAEDRRRAMGLPPDSGHVLAIGTVEPRKGLDVLMSAMARPELAGLQLAIIGQAGWGAVDPRRLAALAGLGADRLRLLGPRGDADLAAALDGAVAVAVPSRAEGFGLPLLEAMAAGVPVVHSQVPALVEVAGGAGIAVPIGDDAALAEALAAVAGDPALARRMSERGRARAAAFTWDAAARATWDVHLAVQ
jgi:glycosyltransferase involved in cell wall biosynthesis